MTDEHREMIRQFFTFAVIGVANTAIDFAIYGLLTRHVGVFDYRTPGRYVANVISFGIATTFSFYCNRIWTFRRRYPAQMTEVARFYTTTVSGLLWNTAILFVLSSMAGINDLIAKLCATLFSMIWNFFFKKYWVFAK
ncbi:GtrA family protein [Candidatus Kaiserbacteria bacterium]|nr:GtrA family protein [Candidatus Kaiserbacteria bacterium]